MNKALGAATIIPPALYVHRDADRQLRRVVEEMGRPGYVLVARQMGKTNLLLNAKRELQQAGDYFLYVDLSNQFSSAQACFRNIIDTALDSSDFTWSTAAERCRAIRKEGLPDHKEHERELRALLRDVSGKLVVILDEVDSLTASPFSDHIFAQIRSVYFSRVNIQEFERLTYVLSGVAEPSELIKNAKLSPFNIGEKIYLDDFSEEEFECFLAKAGLSLSPDVSARIFHWTRGNPRMSWDTCAAIEDRALAGTVTPSTVDEVVRSLYLTSYDRAPIDHIRTLTEQSPEIRGALTEIRYSKGAHISDSAWSRLYLSGIVTSNRSEVRIKNPVVEKALSTQWLEEVERAKTGLLKMADDRRALGRLEQAKTLYQEYLLTGNPSEDKRAHAIDGLFCCEIEAGKFAEAIGWLERARWDRSRYPALYFTQRRKEGICHFSLEQYRESIQCFEECLESSTEDRQRVQDLLNLASALFRADAKQYCDRVIELYETVIKTPYPPGRGTHEPRNVEVIARFNLGRVYFTNGQIEPARQHLMAAIHVATQPEQAVLLADLVRLTTQSDVQRELLEKCVDLILEEKLLPSRTRRFTELHFTVADLHALIAAAYEIDETQFDRLMQYVADSWVEMRAVGFGYETLLARLMERPEIMRKFVARVFDVAEASGDEKDVAVSAKLLAFYAKDPQVRSRYFERYVSYLANRSDEPALDRLDFQLLVTHVNGLFQEGRFDEVSSLLGRLDSVTSRGPADVGVLFAYFRMALARVSLMKEQEVAAARQILEMVTEDKKWTWLGRGDVREIRKGASVAVFESAEPVKPFVRLGRKINRNEVVRVRYADGRVLSTKYKKVERDIQDGLCVLESASR